MLQHKKYLPEFIFGSIDGLVTTFAVVSGVVGATLSPTIILILGFANLFADGFSMAVSNYLSSQSGAALGQDASGKIPVRSASVTFVSFILVGFIPLAPFLFDFGNNNFVISIIFTLTAFFCVGYIKGFVTNTNSLVSALQTLAMGSLAALIAYGVGSFLSGLGV